MLGTSHMCSCRIFSTTPWCRYYNTSIFDAGTEPRGVKKLTEDDTVGLGFELKAASTACAPAAIALDAE